jgi:hypothetical protein
MVHINTILTYTIVLLIWLTEHECGATPTQLNKTPDDLSDCNFVEVVSITLEF